MSWRGDRRKHDRHLFLCTKECFHRKKLLETGWQNIKVFRNVTYCKCTRTCVKLVLFKTDGTWPNDSSRSEKQGTSQQYKAHCVGVCVRLPVNRQCMLGVVSHSSLEEHEVKLSPAGVKDRVLGGHERERLFSLFKSDCLSLHPSVPSVTGRTLCPGSNTCYTSGPAWPCTALWPSSFKSVSRLWRVNKWIHLHKGERRDRDAWNWKGQSRFAARQLWYKREIRTVVLVGGYCCWSLRAWSQYWTAANRREHRDMFVFIGITCKMLLAGSGTFCGQSLRAV